MTGNITRRDLLKFVGGTGIGLVFTPVPWKLLDDTAIWTQNGYQQPHLPAGRLSFRNTTCTLCPAGCGLRLRCINGRPVSVAGAAGRAGGRGALCPLGPAAHHVTFHPGRLSGPGIRVAGRDRAEFRPASVAEIAAILGAAIRTANRGNGHEAVAILDGRPGRSISALYRGFLARLERGIYLRAPAVEEAWHSVLETMLEEPYGPIGYDLENAGLILSFGEPVLEGWSAPDRLPGLRFSAAGAAGRPRLIQVETRPSPTALLADRWLGIRPGTELALALGLANVIVGERLYGATALRANALDFDRGGPPDYLRLIRPFTPRRVAGITGLDPGIIIETARDFATRGPAIALGGGDAGGGPLGPEEERAIWGLNLLVGSLGRTGGCLPRRPLPDPMEPDGSAPGPGTEIASVPDGTVRVLIMDGAPSGSSLPWSLLKRKLVERDAMVVSLSPFLIGHAVHADLVVPSAPFLEGLEEAVSPPGAVRASLALAPALLPPSAGVTDPVDLLVRTAAAAGVGLPESRSTPSLIETRLRALHAAGRGRLFDRAKGEALPVRSIGSAGALIERMRAGATWVDDDTDPKPVPGFRLLGREADGFERMAAVADGRGTGNLPGAAGSPLVLMPFGIRGFAGGGPVTGLASKLYRESGLRIEPGCVLVNPQTGKRCGVRDGAGATIETAAGRMRVRVRYDTRVRTGVIHAPVGPDPDQLGEAGGGFAEELLALCETGDGSVWRVTPASLHEG